MRRKDLLPLKAVVDELGVSRWTLWRAMRSDIADFPAPIIVARRLFWEKSKLDALEAALMQFKGRCVFDRKRRHERVVRKFSRTKPARARKQKNAAPLPGQRDLFS